MCFELSSWVKTRKQRLKVTPDSQKGILDTAFINPTRNIKVKGNP